MVIEPLDIQKEKSANNKKDIITHKEKIQL